jgi:hypothetical protein
LVRIIWEGEQRPDLDEFVLREAQDLVDAVGSPSQIVIHHVWIDGDPKGRTVLLFGKEGDDTAIYAEYIEKPVFGP